MSYINKFKSYDDIFPSTNTAFNMLNDLLMTSKNVDLFNRSDAKSELSDDMWKVELDVPGFKQDQITVEINKNDYADIITIAAKSKTRSKNFSYELKQNVFDYEKYTMKLDLGILTIEIPKLKDQNNPKKIELKF